MRFEAAGIPRLSISAGVATLEDGHRCAPPRRGQAAQSRTAPEQGAARRHDRHRPHPLGDPRQAERESMRIPMRRSAWQSSTTALSRILPSCAPSWNVAAQSSRPKPIPKSSRILSAQNCAGAARRLRRWPPRLPRLKGAFALAFLFDGENDLLIGARRGSPLAIGYGDGEMYLGSDAIALAPFTDSISYLEEGATGSRCAARA